MAEPISVILALAPLVKNGFSKIVESDSFKSVFGSITGGPVEEVSGNLATSVYNKLINNLPEILATPENHDLLRSIRRSYLNATLVMCFSRLQIINPSKFDIKNLGLQLFKKEEPNKIIQYIKDLLSSSDTESNEEIEWLFRAVNHFHNQLTTIHEWKVTETFEDIAKNVQLLLKPENAASQISTIQSNLKAELIAELASTAYFQNFDTKESVGKKSYNECLPPKLLESIEKGWVLLKEDGTFLRQSDEAKTDFEWFDVMSVFFAQEIKSNQIVSNIFNAKMLADLKYQNQSYDLSANKFADHLAESNKIILESLENVERNVGKIKEDIKFLLPLRTTVESVEILLNFLSKKLDKGFKESKKRDEKILEGINQLLKQSQQEFQLDLSFIPAPKLFIGRTDDLNELLKAQKSGKTSFILHGSGGVGKTELAKQFICELKSAFPKQIQINMLGLTENALTPKEVMLQAITTFNPEISSDLDEQEVKKHYVSLLNQHKPLLFFDNAKDRDQVESLIIPSSLIIITTRTTFNVTGGFSKEVYPLSIDDSVKLLYSITNDEKRFDGQAPVLAKLAGYMPMALLPLASLLAEDKTLKARDLVKKYTERKELLKLADPNSENLSVSASFDLSYDNLDEKLKECWRKLSVFPADFNLDAMQAIWEIADAKTIRSGLVKKHLLEFEQITGRSRLHDLAREYVTEKVLNDELVKTQQLFLIFYGKFAESLEEATPENLVKFDVEKININKSFKWLFSYVEKHEQIEESVSSLITLYGNLSAEILLIRLGTKELKEFMEQALNLNRKTGDRYCEGGCLINLGVVYQAQGDYSEAINKINQALSIFEEIGNQDGEMVCLANLGQLHLILTDFQQAFIYNQKALSLVKELKDRRREGNSIRDLGNIYEKTGNFLKAIECYEKALLIMKEFGHSIRFEALTLADLGNTYLILGKYKKSVEYFKKALAITQEIKDIQNEGRILGRLGLNYLCLGETAKALNYMNDGLVILESIDSPEALHAKKAIDSLQSVKFPKTMPFIARFGIFLLRKFSSFRIFIFKNRLNFEQNKKGN